MGWEQALEWGVGHQSPNARSNVPMWEQGMAGLLTIQVGPLLVHIHQDCINGWTHLEAEKVLG